MPVAVPHSVRHPIGRVRDLRVREIDLIGVHASPVHLAGRESRTSHDSENPHIERRVAALIRRAERLGASKRRAGGNGPQEVLESLFGFAEREAEANGPFVGLPDQFPVELYEGRSASARTIQDETVATPGAESGVAPRAGADALSLVATLAPDDLLPPGELQPLSLLPDFLFE